MRGKLFLGALILASGVTGTVSAATLEEVRERGTLRCGVSTGLVGFAAQDANGTWEGFDAAFCRAVAGTVLGDSSAVEFVPTTGESRFEALRQGEVDLLARNTTWTYARDSAEGVDYAGINYYDGQGFMVPQEAGIMSARDLDGETICVETGTTSALNLADFAQANGMNVETVSVDTPAEAQTLYLEGECTAFTSDASALAASRATFETPGDHVILPEIISKEPLGPVVRQGDDRWADVVRWTLNALIAAEEYGITSANVADIASSAGDDAATNRLLGTTGDFGEMLNLSDDWAVNAISAGGNYGEIFARHIGEDTPVGLARGLNAQWTDGGLLYAPPFR